MACKNLHVITNYTATAGSTMLNLTFSKPVRTVTDRQRFCIKFCVDIPEIYEDYTVQVIINEAGVPLWDKYGNPLKVSDLRKGTVYQGYYGSTTSHIILNAPKYTGCNCAV